MYTDIIDRLEAYPSIREKFLFLKTFSELYDDLQLTKFIYCFYLNEIHEVLECPERKALVKDAILPEYLSLQEMLVWVAVGRVQNFEYNMKRVKRAADHTLDFGFISHRHASDDRLGSEVVEAMGIVGEVKIWMDLCSMCQDGFSPSYRYDHHTKPIIELLDVIMKKSSKAFILLNTTPMNSRDYDPLRLQTYFVRFLMGIDDLKNWAGLERYLSPADEKFIRRLISQILSDWIPFVVNEYFGRLWCYVERLAMNVNEIHIYQGKRYHKFNPKAHLDHVQLIYRYYEICLERTYLQTHYQYGPHLREDIWPTIQSFYYLYLLNYQLVFGTGEWHNLMILPKNDLEDIVRCINTYELLTSLPKSLGPFLQVSLLKCFDPKDRFPVAMIENKLRQEPPLEEALWKAALDIAIPSLSPLPIEVTSMNQLKAWIEQLIFRDVSSLRKIELDGPDQVTLRISELQVVFMYIPSAERWKLSYTFAFPPDNSIHETPFGRIRECCGGEYVCQRWIVSHFLNLATHRQVKAVGKSLKKFREHFDADIDPHLDILL